MVGLVLQTDLDRRRRAAGSRRPLGLEEQGLGTVEAEIDRVERVDRGEQRTARPFARRDQIAGIDLAIRDPACDRGADLGELDIERTGANTGLCRRDRGTRRTDPGLEPLDIALRHRLDGDQPLGAAEIRFGERLLALRAGEAGARLGECRGERPRVEGEEQLALLDDRAVGEVDAGDLPRDARTHLDAAARLEPADIIVPFVHLADQRLGDGDGGRRRRGNRRRLAVEEADASGNEQHRQRDECALLPERTTAAVERARLGRIGLDRVDTRDHVHARIP
jgi:hypothetical protein